MTQNHTLFRKTSGTSDPTKKRLWSLYLKKQLHQNGWTQLNTMQQN